MKKNAIAGLAALILVLFGNLAWAKPCGDIDQPPCDVPEPSSLPLALAGLGAAIAVGVGLRNRK